MTRKPRIKEDALEHEIVQMLNPGEFISDRECFSFVSDLDAVVAKIGRLTAGAPERAVALYETFLACCYEKAEEIDDSSGCFGQCVEDIVCGWIRARQAAGADPTETAARLLAWMDDDPYGFCYNLEKFAAGVFNKAGRTAFIKLLRERYDWAGATEPASDGPSMTRMDHQRRRLAESLRTLYLAQKDVTAYVAIAEETGLTTADCHALATILVGKRKPQEALVWVERGLASDVQGRSSFMGGGSSLVEAQNSR